MIIGVNARCVIKEPVEGAALYTYQVLLHLAQQNPEHRFYVFFDRAFGATLLFPKNVTPLVLSPVVTNVLNCKYWFDIAMPRALKKISAAVFLSFDGWCSLGTKVPQYLVVYQLCYQDQQSGIDKIKPFFNNYYQRRFFKKATKVFVPTHYLKNEISSQFSVPDQKIEVIYSGINPLYQQLTFEEKAVVKESYTDGYEYFICVVDKPSHDAIIPFLKAFSLFKKRQRSNFRLVLLLEKKLKDKSFETLLQTYKYRQDLVVLSTLNINEKVGLIASAYAVLYSSYFEAGELLQLQALQCGAPCLTPAHAAIQEIIKDAALYFNETDPANIGEQLMLIYKDETLRSALIEKGKAVADSYTWQQTATLIGNSFINILKTN